MIIPLNRPKKLPKTLGTKVNRITYQNLQEEAEKRGLSESQFLRVIISEIITFHTQELLIIPESGMHDLTELSFTLGTKVPLETYLTFCIIAKNLKITQSNLLRFGIEAELQNDNSFTRIKANTLNSSIHPQKDHRETQYKPQASVRNKTQPEKTEKSVTANNWIEEMQKRAARNLALGHQITQVAKAFFLLMSKGPEGISRSALIKS